MCRQMDEHHIHGLHPWSTGRHHPWSCTSHVNTNTILQHGTMISNKNEWLIVTHLRSKDTQSRNQNFNQPITMRRCHASYNAVSATGGHEPLVESMLFSTQRQRLILPGTTSEKMDPTASCRCSLECRFAYAQPRESGWGLHS